MSQETNTVKQHNRLEDDFLINVQSNSLTEIKSLLQKYEPYPDIIKALINESWAEQGFLALHIAAMKGYTELTKWLLENGADASIFTQKTGLCALQLSIEFKHLSVSIELLPVSDISQLNTEELRGLLLALLVAEQHHSVRLLLEKTTLENRENVLVSLGNENDPASHLAKRVLISTFPSKKSLFKKNEPSPLQQSIASNELATSIVLLHYTDVNSLSKKEFRALLLQLINDNQVEAIRMLLTKASIKTKRNVLDDWIIENKHCLIFALEKNREIFNLFAEHGVSPFFNPLISSARPAFIVVVEAGDLEAAFKLLMSQKDSSISQYDYGFEYIPSFLHQCIANSDVAKIKAVIPHLAKAAISSSDLAKYMSWHNVDGSTFTTLAERSLEKGMPEFLETALDYLPDYINKCITIPILNLMFNKKYFGLICKILTTHSNKNWLISEFHYFNNYYYKDNPSIHRIADMIRFIINGKSPELLKVLISNKFWKEELEKQLFDFAIYATYKDAAEILKLFLIINPLLISLEQKDEDLIHMTVRFQSEASYNVLKPFYEAKGLPIPEFENPLYSNTVSSSEAFVIQKGPGSRPAEESTDFKQISKLLHETENYQSAIQPNTIPLTQSKTSSNKPGKATVAPDFPAYTEGASDKTTPNANESFYNDNAL